MREVVYTGGRIGVFDPDHPKANNRGYVLRSRHVMELHLKRYLPGYPRSSVRSMLKRMGTN